MVLSKQCVEEGVSLRRLKKTTLVSLVVVMLLSVFVGVVHAETGEGRSGDSVFYDVPEDHWASKYIADAYNKGYIQGDGGGKFRPDDNLTIVEFIAMLTNAFPDELSVSKHDGMWYLPYIDLAEKLGLSEAYVTTIRNDFTRGDLAGAIYYILSGQYAIESDSVEFLLDSGISTGVESATYTGYLPRKSLTRAEGVTFLYRVIEYVEENQDGLLLSGRDPLHGIALEDPRDYIKRTESIAKTKLKGVGLGVEVDELIRMIGEPERIDPTTHIYDWYIYNDQGLHWRYAVADNKVVGLFSNSAGVFSGGREIEIGVSHRGDISRLSELTQSESFFREVIEDGYILESNFDILGYGHIDVVETITIKHLDYARAPRSDLDMDEISKAQERGNFDLTNAFRHKHGVPLLQWSELAYRSAYKHSKDMYERNYFSHTSPEGLSSSARMKAEGINYSSTGENIASGYSGDIQVYMGWLNSEGHRRNMLNSRFTNLGVGIYKKQYTQNFYSERRNSI